MNEWLAILLSVWFLLCHSSNASTQCSEVPHGQVQTGRVPFTGGQYWIHWWSMLDRAGGQCWMEALFQVWWVQTPQPAMYGKVQHLRLYARLLTMVNGQCSTPVAW